MMSRVIFQVVPHPEKLETRALREAMRIRGESPPDSAESRWSSERKQWMEKSNQQPEPEDCPPRGGPVDL